MYYCKQGYFRLVLFLHFFTWKRFRPVVNSPTHFESFVLREKKIEKLEFAQSWILLVTTRAKGAKRKWASGRIFPCILYLQQERLRAMRTPYRSLRRCSRTKSTKTGTQRILMNKGILSSFIFLMSFSHKFFVMYIYVEFTTVIFGKKLHLTNFLKEFKCNKQWPEFVLKKYNCKNSIYYFVKS